MVIAQSLPRAKPARPCETWTAAALLYATFRRSCAVEKGSSRGRPAKAGTPSLITMQQLFGKNYEYQNTENIARRRVRRVGARFRWVQQGWHAQQFVGSVQQGKFRHGQLERNDEQRVDELRFRFDQQHGIGNDWFNGQQHQHHGRDDFRIVNGQRRLVFEWRIDDPIKGTPSWIRVPLKRGSGRASLV